MKQDRTSRLFLENQPQIAEFYLDLHTNENIQLIKTVAPSTMNRGDTFYIYKAIHNAT